MKTEKTLCFSFKLWGCGYRDEREKPCNFKQWLNDYNEVVMGVRKFTKNVQETIYVMNEHRISMGIKQPSSC